MAKDRITKQVTTGKGTITGFTAIFEPSYTYNENGAYSASLILDEEEGKKLVQIAKTVAKEQFATYGKQKKAPISPLINIKPLTTINDEGEEVPDEQGRYILKTSAKAWAINKNPENYILVVDSLRRPMARTRIGEGTVARFFISIEGYTTPKETNVSMVLKAVQIIQLVKNDRVDVDSTGFDEEADGYIAPDEEEPFEDTETAGKAGSKENEDEDFDF